MGPITNVQIIAEFGSDIQFYARQFVHLTVWHPRNCPQCAAADRLVGHGSYPRNVVCSCSCRVIAIRIKRFLCGACRKTISVLPSFCLPWRHYDAATIQTVLDCRRTGGSWSDIGLRFAPSDVPTRTTCQEWVVAFAEHSSAYLQRLVQQLGQWQLAPGKIEVAIKEIADAGKASWQLVVAVPHLVAFLRDNGVEIASGTARWLATLWQWGYSQGLGRLV